MRRWATRLLLFLVFPSVAFPCAPSRVVAAAHTTRVRTSIAARGIRLTLTLPGRVYPRDALIRATVRLQNVSHHDVGMVERCPPDIPWVEVAAASGSILYPPAIDQAIEIKGCHPVFPTVLHPGADLVHHPYLILRGPLISAAVALAPAHPSHPVLRGSHRVVTRPIRLTLTAGSAPTLTLVTQPEVAVDVQPTVPESGPLHVISSYACFDATGGAGGTSGWTKTRSMRIVLDPGPCAHPVVHVAAGWLNQPVAVLDSVNL